MPRGADGDCQKGSFRMRFSRGDTIGSRRGGGKGGRGGKGEMFGLVSLDCG